MEGHRGEAHTALLAEQNCDVWLLTEVHHHLELPGGYRFAARSDDMAHAGQRAFKQWAAIATGRDASALTATHPATAAARIGSTTYASSILPWAGSGGAAPWSGANHADRMANALAALEPFFAAQDGLVWGGDWNQALEGTEYRRKHCRPSARCRHAQPAQTQRPHNLAAPPHQRSAIHRSHRTASARARRRPHRRLGRHAALERSRPVRRRPLDATTVPQLSTLTPVAGRGRR